MDEPSFWRRAGKVLFWVIVLAGAGFWLLVDFARAQWWIAVIFVLFLVRRFEAEWKAGREHERKALHDRLERIETAIRRLAARIDQSNNR